MQDLIDCAKRDACLRVRLHQNFEGSNEWAEPLTGENGVLTTISHRRPFFVIINTVETIGDCYMAATGLPDPQPNHALIMSRFAWDCLRKMDQMTQALEITLG